MRCPLADSSAAGFFIERLGAGDERRDVAAGEAFALAEQIAPFCPQDHATTRRVVRRAEAMQSVELPLRRWR